MSEITKIAAASESTARFVVEHSIASRVMMRHGIDFCCQGDRSLDEACAQAGISTASLLAEVQSEVERTQIINEHWDIRPIDEVIDHILSRYHDPLKRELVRLGDLGLRLKHAHPGQKRLFEAIDVMNEFAHSMSNHLTMEERMLFPWIRSGKLGGIGIPIGEMTGEHAELATYLHSLRNLTEGFRPPPTACSTWRAFYAALAELESEVMEHVHLENHVLVPRICSNKP